MDCIKSLSIQRPTLESGLSRYEQVSNYMGLLPFICNASGTLRMIVGIFQIIGALFAGDTPMLRHGLCNLSRGSIECTWLLSVAFSFIYDRHNRVDYGANEVSMPNPWQFFAQICA